MHETLERTTPQNANGNANGTGGAELREIELDLLDSHPNNPRLYLREDVVESIAAALKESGVFGDHHAILARPIGERFQMVDGHHRFEAAKRAGLEKIKAWVREMSDEEADIEIQRCNEQSDFSNLELGRLALRVAGDGSGGNDGRLAGFARKINKKLDVLSKYRTGALFFEKYAGDRLNDAAFCKKCGKKHHISTT